MRPYFYFSIAWNAFMILLLLRSLYEVPLKTKRRVLYICSSSLINGTLVSFFGHINPKVLGLLITNIILVVSILKLNLKQAILGVGLANIGMALGDFICFLVFQFLSPYTITDVHNSIWLSLLADLSNALGVALLIFAHAGIEIKKGKRDIANTKDNTIAAIFVLATLIVIAFHLNWLGTAPDHASHVMTIVLFIFFVLASILYILSCYRLKEKDSQLDELKTSNEEIRLLADLDKLTGCFNRRAGLERAEKLLERAERENRCITICFIDLDNLKETNDNFGHHEGDRFLIKVSEVFQRNARENDLIFRFGGDEFVIAFFDLDLEEAEKIWSKISMETMNLDLSIDPGMSHGMVCISPGKNIQLCDAIRIADEIMYEEKRRKRMF